MLKNPHYERWRWQIFAITWLAYAGFYFTRLPFSVAKIEMGKEPLPVCYASTIGALGSGFGQGPLLAASALVPGRTGAGSGIGLSREWMGWIDGAYLTTYAVGMFFWGLCGDRYGARKVILICMLGSIVTAAATGAASVPWTLMLLLGIQGLCQAGGWPPLTKNMSYFYSLRERGTVIGLWSTNYALGGFLAALFAGYIGDWWGWRYAFYASAGTLAVIWLLFLLLQRNRPEDVGLPPIEIYHGEKETVLAEDETHAEEPEGSWKVIIEVCRNPMVLLLSLVYFFMKPARYAILFWAPKYLSEKLGTNMLDSGALSGLFQLAGPVSVFVGGLLSDKLFDNRRNPVSVICLVLLAAVLFVFDKLPATGLMLGGGFFLIGMLIYAPDSLVSGTAAIDFGSKKGASTASGVITGVGSVGAIAGGTLPGVLHHQLGWNGLFQVLSVCVLIAGLLLLPKWNAKPVVAK